MGERRVGAGAGITVTGATTPKLEWGQGLYEKDFRFPSLSKWVINCLDSFQATGETEL
jgi:hypothetical protein